MIEETLHKYLRHIIDFDGKLTQQVTSYAFGVNLVNEFFFEYVSAKNSFTQTSESMLYDIAVEYYDEYRRPIPESVVIAELTHGNALTTTEKKDVIDTLNAIKLHPVNENEIPHIATLIREHYQRVRSYYVIQNSLDNIHENPSSAIRSLQNELHRIKQVADYRDNDVANQTKTHLLMMEDQFEHFYKNEGLQKATVQFGFKSWDIVYGGMAPGELCILSANPGVGKSFFLKEVSYNVAFNQKKRVVIADREMNDAQNFARLLSRETGIPQRKLRQLNKLTEAELELVEAVREKHARGEYEILWIPFSRASTPRAIKREIEAAFGQERPDLITVDYIDELECPSRMQTWEGIQYNAAALKALGEEMQCPIWTATQNNASGLRTDDPDGAVVAQRSLLKKANFLAVLYQDKKRPFAPPQLGEFEGIPGIIIAKVVKARSEALGEFEMLVDYSKSVVQDYDGTAVVNRVLEPEPKRKKRDVWN